METVKRAYILTTFSPLLFTFHE